MLAQRLRRWANNVQMLYKCFAFTRVPWPTFINKSSHTRGIIFEDTSISLNLNEVTSSGSICKYKVIHLKFLFTKLVKY